MTDPSRFVVPPDLASASTATDDPAPAAGTPTADPSPVTPEAAAAPAPPAAPAEPSAAELRFQSCRWRKAETPPFCSHPEVLPFAGTNGFSPDSWCPNCAFYKLRRNPRRDY
jgi:hypothetical protein